MAPAFCPVSNSAPDRGHALPISPAREIAYKILRCVDSGRGFAVDLLHDPSVTGLRERDQRLAMELVMGVLRWRGELDFQIQQLSGKALEYFDPEVRSVLRMGIYQIGFLEKIPKSAAVNESVELVKAARKRSAAGMVNAVLRKCQPPARRVRSAESTAELAKKALRTLPDWLRERWEQSFGEDAIRSLAAAAVSVPPTTLRVTGTKREEELRREGIKTRPGLFSNHALIVESGNVQASAAWREGRVVIQDEASQLVASLLSPKAGERVLDLCAAPGIKTGQIAAAMGIGHLIACDLSAKRLRTMAGLARGNFPAAIKLDLVRLNAAHQLPFTCGFDRILLDAPCSGTGTLARNPEIKWRLQPGDLDRLAVIQAGMLKNALPLLAPGGRLVYATCSLEPEENEQVVDAILESIPGFRLRTHEELASEFPALAALFDARGFFRTRPDLHEVDGFFAAVITRVA
jgi:16S rRNA (cytosine967-C5)-methyltransferase